MAKNRDVSMRKYSRETGAVLARKDYEGEKLPGTGSKIGESELGSTKPAIIKTLAGARWHEMGKVKDELKAMLPILKPSEVISIINFLLKVYSCALLERNMLNQIYMEKSYILNVYKFLRVKNRSSDHFHIDFSSRRFYLLPHEALIHELEENGYDESIGFLKQLLELDEETQKQASLGTLMWKKPCLRDNKRALLRLKEGLFAFEQAKNVGDSASMIMALLHTAVFFQTMTWEWWWVAEQLYRSAMTKVIEHEDQRTITVIRYLFGRFLFEQLQNTEESLEHLKVAREVSKGKSWNASKLTGREEQSIFRECNVLLYKTLLMHARQAKPDQPDIAVKACTEALARATDYSSFHILLLNLASTTRFICGDVWIYVYSNHIYCVFRVLNSKQHKSPQDVLKTFWERFYVLRTSLEHPLEILCCLEYITGWTFRKLVALRASYLQYIFTSEQREYIEEALYELGQSQMRSSDIKHALQSFSKLLALAKRVPDSQAVCNAHMALALAYKKLDNETNTEKHLHLSKEKAAEFGLTRQLAQAQYYTGEYFLSKRRPNIATAHLEKSFDLYCELGLHDEADKARIIAGVSRGQKNIDKYIDLVRRCGTADSKAISSLCQWKNCRSAFWKEL
ncbi:uncharacterized protein LOC116841535 [Odontomachus brunneus]|uniref:uncharacterized protein LOC116841535 n=1 Tax=Odontomachus brunneus TaxID=486640 RepID=UPI0013F18478|nr:uncharacterized protein LOC116841535 [Odontomachus brunneus]